MGHPAGPFRTADDIHATADHLSPVFGFYEVGLKHILFIFGYSTSESTPTQNIYLVHPILAK